MAVYLLLHYYIILFTLLTIDFLGRASGEEPACQCRKCKTRGSIPRSGRSPGGGHGHPLQYSCLENPVDRGAWQATVHRVTKSWTRLIQR